jgi:phage terminase large subunit
VSNYLADRRPVCHPDRPYFAQEKCQACYQGGAFIIEAAGKTSVIYDPLPHQIAFHQSKARYTLMSGGRGSGKSLAMRMEALMMAYSIPNFKALILRRTAPELKKSHLMELPFELAKMGLPKDALHVTDMVVRMPHNHSLVQFGHVEDDQALTKWLSSQWSACLIDELTTFSYVQFTWLLTSLRTTIPGLVPYFKGGTNPVGPGAGFVRDLWVSRAAAQKPEKYPGYNPEDYVNIHCNLDDNPHVDPENYAKVFAGIPSKATRDALRHGIWAIEGQFFEQWAETRNDKPWHVIDKLPKINGIDAPWAKYIEVFRAMDWGFRDPGVVLWIAAMPDGSLVVFDELVFRGMLPEELAAEIKARSEGLKVRYTVADPAVWAEHEGPSIAERIEQAGVPMIEGDRQRQPGWIAVHTWLSTTTDDGTGERPKLQVYRHGCPYLIQTIPEMVIDDKDPEDMKTKGVEDHACDALRYALQSRPTASRLPAAETSRSWMMREMMKSKGRTVNRLGSEARHR